MECAIHSIVMEYLVQFPWIQPCKHTGISHVLPIHAGKVKLTRLQLSQKNQNFVHFSHHQPSKSNTLKVIRSLCLLPCQASNPDFNNHGNNNFLNCENKT